MKTKSHNEEEKSGNGYSIDFSSTWKNGRKLPLDERINLFHISMQNQNKEDKHLYMRVIDSATDRTVIAVDADGNKKEMLMFGSNNYLGLANHPHIKEAVKKAIKNYGVGIAGPPLLNGYSSLMKELENRLSKLKGTDDTMIFTSGYTANLGLLYGLCTPHDLIIADEYNHASFFDGVKLLRGKCITFGHNNIDQLKNLLQTHKTDGDLFVVVEGVYSMDGDIAPLDKIIPLSQQYNAHTIIDDAHGTGVLGFNGEGIMEELRIKWTNEIIMGTFSKAFALNGGFISGSREVIEYLRFMARTYMFSASLPPVTIAAVLAGIDVIENEPWRRVQLKKNVSFLTRKLKRFGITTPPQAGIISLNVPQDANIRKMANDFNREGIFLNAIEFPAVPADKQRFRISISANHTNDDLKKLVDTVELVWYKHSIFCND
ncbi:pyridoxal phosphate-dependent aminotransferase family protein [uncultured Draconibacterium sp.]|uniref:aminotransferase class I/II-fold pyridoxal phosphate-dependent enzyme n=1 Tax=uncultured Draconibacterium sp. TaxID=1573823 RepID=UPI0029C736E6|nr:pyridoxal phosphate-dependent aminotransferase family protein [uncultured Draconibacterium sp.]